MGDEPFTTAAASARVEALPTGRPAVDDRRTSQDRRRTRCVGLAALGRCDKVSKYRVRATDGSRAVTCCSVHLAQVVKRFVNDWNLAAEVSADA